MYLKHVGPLSSSISLRSNGSSLPSISTKSSFDPASTYSSTFEQQKKMLIEKSISHRNQNNFNHQKTSTFSCFNFTLDEWDKQHVKPTKEQSKYWTKRLERKSTKMLQDVKINTMNFKTKISKDLNMLKSMKSIKKLETFCNDIEEEKSTVLAQNISVSKKRFDFDIFKNHFQKVITSQLTTPQTPKKPKSPKRKIVEEKQELQKVGNELCIMRRIKRLNSKKGDVELQECKEDDEVKIEDRILRQNDLSLKGKYEQMINKQYYKGIIMDKYKMEKMFHDEIAQTIESIKEKNEYVEQLTNDIKNLSEKYNKSREHYITLKDAYDLLGKRCDQVLANKAHKDYFEQAAYLQGRKIQAKEELNNYAQTALNIESEYTMEAPKLRYKLKEAKNDMKCLNQIHDKMIEESKAYYYNLLREGIDVRDSGLSWIIYKLMELEANIDMSYFPKFIDFVSYKYLMDYSKKKYLVAKLNTLIICIRKNFINEENKQANKDKAKKIANIIKKNAFSKDKVLYLINEFNKNVIDKNIILTNEADLADEANTKKALQQIKQMSNETNSNVNNVDYTVDLFGQDRERFKKMIKKCNVSKEEIFNAMVSIKEEISKIESEMLDMKKEQMHYLKKKYEGMRAKGISECVKYDLMFSALFGNHAII